MIGETAKGGGGADDSRSPPYAGEMSGRTEGGAKEHRFCGPL